MDRAVMRWAGFNSLEGLEKQDKALTAIESAQDSLKSKAKSVINGHADANKLKKYGITTSFDFAAFDRAGIYTSAAVRREVGDLTGAFDTAKFKMIKDAVEAARTNGTGEVGGVSLRDWQKLLGKYEADFADQLQNKALLSDNSWERVLDGDKADIGAVRDLAVDFRGVLADNLSSSAIERANNNRATGTQEINASTVATADLVVNGQSAIHKLGDAVKVERQENHRKVADIRKKEKPDGGKGGKGGSK